MLGRLSLSVAHKDPFYDQLHEGVDAQDVARWLEIENDHEIQDAIVKDKLERLFDTNKNGVTEGEVESDCDGYDIEEAVRPQLPSETELKTLFAPLEHICSN
ncbi:hypothetical protein FGB62_37g410 [Gracilaria domingensis]|nr:hypothetical protein FGB62_37g410 [Gracilaria domingensis]